MLKTQRLKLRVLALIGWALLIMTMLNIKLSVLSIPMPLMGNVNAHNILTTTINYDGLKLSKISKVPKLFKFVTKPYLFSPELSSLYDSSSSLSSSSSSSSSATATATATRTTTTTTFTLSYVNETLSFPNLKSSSQNFSHLTDANRSSSNSCIYLTNNCNYSNYNNYSNLNKKINVIGNELKNDINLNKILPFFGKIYHQENQNNSSSTINNNNNSFILIPPNNSDKKEQNQRQTTQIKIENSNKTNKNILIKKIKFRSKKFMYNKRKRKKRDFLNINYDLNLIKSDNITSNKHILNNSNVNNIYTENYENNSYNKNINYTKNVLYEKSYETLNILAMIDNNINRELDEKNTNSNNSKKTSSNNSNNSSNSSSSISSSSNISSIVFNKITNNNKHLLSKESGKSSKFLIPIIPLSSPSSLPSIEFLRTKKDQIINNYQLKTETHNISSINNNNNSSNNNNLRNWNYWKQQNTTITTTSKYRKNIRKFINSTKHRRLNLLNLGRNVRSANFSASGSTKKIQLFIKNRFIQLMPDGIVNGTQDEMSDFTILQRTTVEIGQIKFQGVATCLYLCMDKCGNVFGSRDFTDDCIFNESMEEHHYNTYSSTYNSNSRHTLYLALNRHGEPRKLQIPPSRSLGKLATYTKSLTESVSDDRAQKLIGKLFGKNRVKHGVHHLCDAGKPLVNLTREMLKTPPKCKEDTKSTTASVTTYVSSSTYSILGTGNNNKKRKLSGNNENNNRRNSSNNSSSTINGSIKNPIVNSNFTSRTTVTNIKKTDIINRNQHNKKPCGSGENGVKKKKRKQRPNNEQTNNNNNNRCSNKGATKSAKKHTSSSQDKKLQKQVTGDGNISNNTQTKQKNS